MTTSPDERSALTTTLIQDIAGQLEGLSGKDRAAVYADLASRFAVERDLAATKVTPHTAPLPKSRRLMLISSTDAWEGTYHHMVRLLLDDILEDGYASDVQILAYNGEGDPTYYHGTVVSCTPELITFADDVTVETGDVIQVSI